MYDAIVIGARCAGSPTAMLLARRGFKVLLVDRATIRNDVDGHVWRALEAAPDFLARVREGRREEKWYGTVGVPGYLRKPYGKGWALVGDASYNRDPITAQGIIDAFIDAEAVVAALSAGLSDSGVFDEPLAAHEAARNERVRPMDEFTTHLAALEPPPPDMQPSSVRCVTTRTPRTRSCLRSPARFRCPISCRTRTSAASWLPRMRQRLHRQGLSERSVLCT